MKYGYALLSVGMILMIGCRTEDENISVPTMETSVIACEAGHVTIQCPAIGEYQKTNEFPEDHF